MRIAVIAAIAAIARHPRQAGTGRRHRKTSLASLDWFIEVMKGFRSPDHPITRSAHGGDLGDPHGLDLANGVGLGSLRRSLEAH